MTAGQKHFDEAFYLARYPDVRTAVAHRGFKSGQDHFIQFGLKEGRAHRYLRSFELAEASQDWLSGAVLSFDTSITKLPLALLVCRLAQENGKLDLSVERTVALSAYTADGSGEVAASWPPIEGSAGASFVLHVQDADGRSIPFSLAHTSHNLAYAAPKMFEKIVASPLRRARVMLKKKADERSAKLTESTEDQRRESA